MASKLIFIATLGPILAAAKSFDFVIVGGGTAGLVVANRLTENPSVTVAVIEAGGSIEDVVGNLSTTPAYVGALQETTETNLEVGWGFNTVPQVGKYNATIEYGRVKGLGGCSAHNQMVYGRTSRDAFDLWAESVGDDSWRWDGVLPYFLKAMDFTPPSSTRFDNSTPTYDATLTAQGGPLLVAYPAYASAWSSWLEAGSEAIGIPPTEAQLDGRLVNTSTWFLTTANHTMGKSVSSDKAYLDPVMGRENLFVYTKTMAEKILFNGTTAIGVQVKTEDDTLLNLTANTEVILSAGVFQSPQLMMVSGVGPADVLEKLDIPVVANLSGVGQNWQDHMLTFVTFQVNLESATKLQESADAVAAFDTTATGILTNTGADYGTFLKVPADLRANWSTETIEALAAYPADWPEGGFEVVPYNVTPITGGPDDASYASIAPALNVPLSVGSVTITSASMYDAPVLDPQFFTAQSDLDVLVALFKLARKMAATEAMSGVIIGEVFPGSSVSTDEEIEAFIREASGPLSHAVATNKMGVSSDPMAVIDSGGKVHGVSNLRVVDASSFPFLIPGPAPQAHVYMLAEKLSDAIKKDHGLSNC